MRMAERISETKISKSIMEYLAARHILAFRQNTGAVVSEYKGKQRFMRFGTPGMADLLAFVNSPFAGLIVHWLEVKTATGKQSELQKSFQNQVEAAGHRYSVVRSIEDVETALK